MRKTREGIQPFEYNTENMLMQCQGAYSKNRRHWAENNHAITAEVQDNYPTFRKNLAEKEHFLISTVSENQPMCTKCDPGAARFQMLEQLGVE